DDAPAFAVDRTPRRNRMLQRFIEAPLRPVGSSPELLEEHVPADPVMDATPGRFLVVTELIRGNPLRQTEVSPPNRGARLVACQSQSRVDGALEEPPEDRPGQLGGDGIGQDESRDRPVADRQLDRPLALALEFDEAEQPMRGAVWRQVADRLRHL